MKGAFHKIFWPVRAARDNSGTVAIEFAIIVPAMLLIVLGGLVFAITLGNYLVVANAAGMGASQLIVSRGSATPYTTTTGAVNAAATGLTTASLTITVKVNGTPCASDAACQTALSNAASQQASVSVAYPCNLTVMDVNFAPGGCTLQATIVGLVQ